MLRCMLLKMMYVQLVVLCLFFRFVLCLWEVRLSEVVYCGLGLVFHCCIVVMCFGVQRLGMV